jgi:hypothetical protein
MHLDEHLGDRVDVREETPTRDPSRNVSCLQKAFPTRTSMFALLNGGTAGLIWGYLIVWIGYMLVFASIAEMASM